MELILEYEEIEEDIYAKEYLEEAVEDDQIDAAEAAFMKGYNAG